MVRSLTTPVSPGLTLFCPCRLRGRAVSSSPSSSQSSMVACWASRERTFSPVPSSRAENREI